VFRITVIVIGMEMDACFHVNVINVKMVISKVLKKNLAKDLKRFYDIHLELIFENSRVTKKN
jgi:hypothetical protein